MTMVNGAVSTPKTNLYRLGVGQPLVIGGQDQPFGNVNAGGQQADTPANFCANMLNIQTAFIAADQTPFSARPSPVPATGNNLFTFMAARLSASFTNLGCGAFGLKNTVTLTQDTQGVATAVTFSLVPRPPITRHAEQVGHEPQYAAVPGHPDHKPANSLDSLDLLGQPEHPVGRPRLRSLRRAAIIVCRHLFEKEVMTHDHGPG
jgi:hypothetical protein